MPATTRHIRDRINNLIARYFSDPQRMVHLKDGDVLMREGEQNDKIYYVHEGELQGHAEHAAEPTESWLYASKGDLVGIKSFFDANQLSHMTIHSTGASRLSWVRMADVAVDGEVPEKVLMPLFVHALNRRQRHVYELMQQEQAAQKRAAELAQSSQLGQFAAGVAHELNNALAVIARGAQWLSGALDSHMKRSGELEYEVFMQGMRKGRHLSSKDVRLKAQDLQNKRGLSYGAAKRLAQMGLEGTIERAVVAASDESHLQISHSWELGATLRDLAVSAEQAGQVVESMKNLGARVSRDAACVDVMVSIESALTILRNVTRGIEVTIGSDGHRACMRGNKGEMVQIWMNLIRNACDALRGADMLATGRQPHITISVSVVDEEVIVTIADNGPGIPRDVLPRIFEPSFTTKKSGLDFGLGLGLSIVKKIASGYGGSVTAGNSGNGALFTVSLPRAVCEEDGLCIDQPAINQSPT